MLNTCEEDGRLVLDGSGRQERWAGEWEGPFSAHPRFDPHTNELFNLSIDQTPAGAGRVIAGHLRDGALVAQRTVYAPATDRATPMGWLHDFFLTEHYLIFPDISVRWDRANLMGDEASVFHFDEAVPLRWGVLARNFTAGAEIQWFETAHAGSIWHVVNAWERTAAHGGTEIVMYAPVFPSYPANIPIHTSQEPPAQFKTWVLDLASGRVTDERLLIDHGYERPSLNLIYSGKPSRYCYLLDEHGDGYMGTGVLKYDLLEEQELQYVDYGGMYGGEALFVPKADSKAEDDGYLLELLMADERADLLVLDASSMTEIARLHLPRRVPFGVHSCWLNPTELAALGT